MCSDAGGVFNPSVLVLPDTVGVGWRHLLVARGPERYEVIEKEDTRWESIVGCVPSLLLRAGLRGQRRRATSEIGDLALKEMLGRCFLLPLKRQYLDLPYLARESELETLKLPAERKVDYMRCHEAVYDQVGPSSSRFDMSCL